MHSHKSSDLEGYTEIIGEYSASLVILSIVFICLAAYTALLMNERAKVDGFFRPIFWYVLASLAMGIGIWSMHYMGMFAFSLEIPIEYNIILTIISIIPALVAAFFAFYIVNNWKLTILNSMGASFLIGLGMCVMHFIGMVSMQMEGLHSYSWSGVFLSLLSAGFAFFVFFSLYAYIHRVSVRLILGMVLGLSLSSMHYISMLTMSFYVEDITILSDVVIPLENRDNLVLNFSMGLLGIIVFLFYTGLSDVYLEHRAENYNPKTHLPNYHLFQNKYNRGQFKQIAIWQLLNLSNSFSDLDDEELLLKQIAKSMREYTSREVKIFHIEKEKFVIATTNLNESFTEKMKELSIKLDHQIEVKNELYYVQAVCAMSIAQNEQQRAQIYDNANVVLNYLNYMTNDKVVCYNPNLHQMNLEDNILHDLKQAMENDELFLVYQPKFSPGNKDIIGFEALLRWQHSTLGFLSPVLFIPILEKYDRIQAVTDWIIDHVCQQINKWDLDGLQYEHISINIPGNYLTSPHLIEVLDDTIKHYHVPPEKLELEITETSFVKDLEKAMRAVELLREQGFAVALDDFGMGLSSLSYLKRMPISTLKIDKSFVDVVPVSSKDSAILQGILALGESLNLNVVVEGVETAEQVAFIRANSKKPIIQGYYYSKPLTIAEINEKYSMNFV